MHDSNHTEKQNPRAEYVGQKGPVGMSLLSRHGSTAAEASLQPAEKMNSIAALFASLCSWK
jgi:hypothetical protein